MVMRWLLPTTLLLILAAPAAAWNMPRVDARDAGLSWGWLVFGFAAQAAFMARFLVQWVATERAKASVIPPAFWVLSLVGGLSLLVYFVRRGDPVGVTGQLFGVVVYSRNLFFILRNRNQTKAERALASKGEESLEPTS